MALVRELREDLLELRRENEQLRRELAASRQGWSHQPYAPAPLAASSSAALAQPLDDALVPRSPLRLPVAGGPTLMDTDSVENSPGPPEAKRPRQVVPAEDVL